MPTARKRVGRAGLDLANRLVRPLDRLAASRANIEPEPIMVVGLPRSGTTLVYELLVQAFEVAFLTRLYSYTYGMPNLTTRLVSRGIRRPYARYDSNYGRIPGRFAPAENAVFWGRWFQEHEVLGHHLPGAAISDDAIRVARRTLSSMSAIARRPYVFKNVYMTLSVPAFLRLLPRSRVIVVTRDTDATISSVFRGRKVQDGWWSIRPPFADDVNANSTIEQTVYQCIRSQQLLDHSLTMVAADRYLVVDYGDVCSDPRGFIDRVEHWVDSSLQRRQARQIPQRFERSPGPGLPEEHRTAAEAFAATVRGSGAEYLARLESYLAETPDDADA